MPRSIRSIPFSRIRREPVRWLWRGRIALGKVNVLEGNGSCGKSTFVASIAARVSRGELEGDLQGEPGVVIIFSAEDGAGDTIRPRLEAHRADLDRVRGIDDTVTLPDDLAALRNMIVRTRARLVVFDPIASFLAPSVSMASDGTLRRTIGPLKEIAADTGAAIVLLRHLNGRSNAPAYRRGLGGASLTNIARSVLVMALHPDDDGDPNGRRVIAYVKGNLEGRQTTSVEVALDNAGRVVIGPEVEISADELLVQQPRSSAARRTSLAEATSWLQEFLDGREVPTTEVEEAAAERDISQRTLERARAEIGVLYRRVPITNFDGTSTWQTVLRLPGFAIPEAAEPATPPAPAPASSASSSSLLPPSTAAPLSPPSSPPSVSAVAARTALQDDASIRFSNLELDYGPSCGGGVDVGGVGGVTKPSSINGIAGAIATPPTAPPPRGDAS